MASIQAFPAITEPEFRAACKALEDRCFDRLNDTDWLSVQFTEEELAIKQRRVIYNTRTGGENEQELQEVAEAETLSRDTDNTGYVDVTFSVTLSPTYSVPILWFTCQKVPGKAGLNLDQVYELLVPNSSQEPLRTVGVMGGISMAHHPISDQPAYFIHPCNTPEALSVLKPERALSPEDYLLLWLGLIGTSVGLYVPSALFGK
ncbi:hypothetical protein PV08_01371 [Exophiala spinifera]|uniref:Ubiquitin-like-conjugating enzyme ATG10 n=1 Tax=Exophiala spinifera TaxID=91928 RepID=A0A0D2BPC7_9EURO|nr:uncharacterized protein PV08_01371 [Exophiala spinifera]KIW20793.1 hypothetical protein PV08_01371 [Exophiala spinifera]